MTARSVEGRPIRAYAFGSGSQVVLFLGGMHGNEPSSVRLMRHLTRWLASHGTRQGRNEVVVAPDINPDGLACGSRRNADHVDINRNFPTANWGSPRRRKGDWPGPRPASEPETRFVLELMRRFRPCRIVSVHAPYHEINIDGPAMAIAEKMRNYNNDRIVRYIGYPTPGSLGTFAGKERHLPVITLELGRRSDEAIWRANRKALLAAANAACSSR